MYDYGSAEDNMKHYGVVSAACVCWEGGGECGVCVGRVVESAGCVLGGWWRVQHVCWEGSGEGGAWH